MSMNVSLGPLEAYVREKVAQGEYGSDSDVLREGLQLLKQREELWQTAVQARIQEGLESCRLGRTLPAEEAWASLHAWRAEQLPDEAT